MTHHSLPAATLRALPPPLRALAARTTLATRTALAALVALVALVALATGAGCASTPPVQLYQLRAATPVAAVAPPAVSNLNWQLLLPVRVPDYLDRDALLVPQGQSGLQAQAGHRWAEPLRESVPRLLRQDLGTLLGQGHVWVAPLPAGVSIERQLRVELLSLQSSADRRSVELRARWSVATPGGGKPPLVDSAELAVPATGSDVDSLVSAHRLALWRLAERIAGAAAAP